MTSTTAPRRPVTFARALAAEWTKVTGVRSTLWTVVATVLMAAGVALGLGMFVRPGDGTTGASLVVSGVVLAQLGTLVLGVLVGTADHTTGAASTTFTAVPRRLPVLAAQVVLTTVLALVAAVVSLGAAIGATVAQRDAVGLVLLDGAGSGRVLVGFVLYLTAVALLGLGAGALLRRPAGALVASVVVLVVADQVLAANPGRVADTVRVLLPGVGTRLVRDDAQVAVLDAANLGPHVGVWGAGLVLAAWVVVVLVAAAVRLRRSDVT